jgi:hypothetical protein
MVVDLVSIMVTSERRAAAARAAGGQQRQRGGGCEGAMQSLLAGRLPFRVVVMIVVDMIISRQRAKLGVPSKLSAESCLVVSGGIRLAGCCSHVSFFVTK